MFLFGVTVRWLENAKKKFDDIPQIYSAYQLRLIKSNTSTLPFALLSFQH